MVILLWAHLFVSTNWHPAFAFKSQYTSFIYSHSRCGTFVNSFHSSIHFHPMAIHSLSCRFPRAVYLFMQSHINFVWLFIYLLSCHSDFFHSSTFIQHSISFTWCIGYYVYFIHFLFSYLCLFLHSFNSLLYSFILVSFYPAAHFFILLFIHTFSSIVRSFCLFHSFIHFHNGSIDPFIKVIDLLIHFHTAGFLSISFIHFHTAVNA